MTEWKKKEQNARHFKVSFLKGIRGTDGVLAEGTKQIAFLGRSNAGKSSTINMLLGKDVAKTSAMPGKTTEINIFDVWENERHFRVLDLPGYGFSKARVKDREKLRKLIIWYLAESGARPAAVALVVDATVPPSPFDREAVALCAQMGHPLFILANKIDRMNQKETHASLRALHEAFPEAEIVPCSAKTHKGKENILDRLFK